MCIVYFCSRIAFESLKLDLDPENKNVPISSERFFEIMNTWAKKIAGGNNESDDEFNGSSR